MSSALLHELIEVDPYINGKKSKGITYSSQGLADLSSKFWFKMKLLKREKAKHNLRGVFSVAFALFKKNQEFPDRKGH